MSRVTAPRFARRRSARRGAALAMAAVLGLPLGTRVAAQVPQPRDTVVGDTLVRDTVRLAPLRAEGTRLPAASALSPAAVSRVDVSARLAAGPALGLDEVLDGIPGVYAANRYNFALDQRLAIRGFGARAGFGIRGVRILLDGVPQTLPDGQSQLTNLQPADLESAVVLRGTASSRYGNASGGVVALQTRPLPARGSEHQLRVAGGSFGTASWTARSAARRGPVAGSVTLSGITTEGHRQHADAAVYQASLAADWLMSAGTSAELRVRLANQPLSLNPGAIDPDAYAVRPDSAAETAILRNARKVVDQQQAALTLRHRTATGLEAALTAYALARDLQNPIATNTIIDLDRAAYGLRLDVSRPIGTAGSRIGVGVDLQRMRDDRLNRVGDEAGSPTEEVTVDQRETVAEIGPFVFAEWRAAPDWLLAAGIRADWVRFEADDRLRTGGVDRGGERDMSALSGHLGVTYAPSPATAVYASLSSAFETPTTTELVNRPDADGGFNPALGPQDAWTVEAGARGSHRRLWWSAAAYRTRVSDAIVQFLAVGGREYFANAGRTAHDGIELAGGAALGEAVRLRLAYSYGRFEFLEYRVRDGETVDTLDGNRIPGVPAHMLHAALEVTRGSVTVTLEQALRSEIWADDGNSLRVGGWGAGVTAIRARASIPWGAAELEPFAALENLFDRRHVSAVTVNGFGGRVLEPAPGRHVYVGLSMRYRTSPAS